MFKRPVVQARLLSRAVIVAAALVSAPVWAATTAGEGVGNTRIHLADATAAQNENFRKAMDLLQQKNNAKPSRPDVDKAGKMLMDAGPDAFERAMNTLKHPDIKSSDVAAAKADMMKGGPDASERAMKLLRQSFGY
jgi:hypothetical protein